MRIPEEIDEAEYYLSLDKDFYANGRSAIWADSDRRAMHNLPVSP